MSLQGMQAVLGGCHLYCRCNKALAPYFLLDLISLASNSVPPAIVVKFQVALPIRRAQVLEKQARRLPLAAEESAMSVTWVGACRLSSPKNQTIHWQ